MPTVIPASAGADGRRLARGVALLAAGEARKAAGEAAASPATPGGFPLGLLPPDPVAVLAHAVTRQAAARQAGTKRVRPAWFERVRAVLPVRVKLALVSG
jgi:hypothetical protein